MHAAHKLFIPAVLTSLLAVSPALAADPPSADAPATQRDSAGLEPKQIDVALSTNTLGFLASVGAGVGADVGVARLGPGTLALGASAEYTTCAVACWALNSVTDLHFGHREISLWGRASYHLSATKKGPKIDLYPFAMVGPTIASATIGYGDTEFRGRDVGIAVGVGVGVRAFVGRSIFVGGEARLQRATGVYDYELVSGNTTLIAGTASHAEWSSSGLDVRFAVGMRF